MAEVDRRKRDGENRCTMATGKVKGKLVFVFFPPRKYTASACPFSKKNFFEALPSPVACDGPRRFARLAAADFYPHFYPLFPLAA